MSTDSDRPRAHPPSETLLHRFVDGDLRGSERVDVEAMLAADGEALAASRSYQQQNILLQALHPRRDEDTMLPAAALNLARGLRRRRMVQRAVAASVAVVALFGAGSAGWQAQSYVEQRLHTPVVAVFPPEAVPTVGGDGGAVAVPSMAPVPTAAGTIAVDAPGWLGKDVRRVPVHPPNLQEVGYQLVDGRADVTAYGPVIRFAYTPTEGADSPRLALTVASFGTDRQSLATTVNPQHASLFWRSGRLLYALSGDVAPGQLLRVADTMTQAKPATARGQGAAPAAGNEGAPAGGDAPKLEVTPVSDQNEPSKEL
jgi:anti-sigma factor RsiW